MMFFVEELKAPEVVAQALESRFGDRFGCDQDIEEIREAFEGPFLLVEQSVLSAEVYLSAAESLAEAIATNYNNEYPHDWEPELIIEVATGAVETIDLTPLRLVVDVVNDAGMKPEDKVRRLRNLVRTFGYR